MVEATFSLDTLLGLPERGAGALKEVLMAESPGHCPVVPQRV